MQQTFDKHLLIDPNIKVHLKGHASEMLVRARTRGKGRTQPSMDLDQAGVLEELRGPTQQSLYQVGMAVLSSVDIQSSNTEDRVWLREWL